MTKPARSVRKRGRERTRARIVSAQPASPPKKRTPVQARAQSTVEAILLAAKELLVSEGIEGTTTNAVAKRAGVSIGSLYQYFDNLEAIVSELSRKHVEQSLGMLFAEAEALRSEPLTVGVRQLIHLMVEVHRQDPEFHRVIESAHPSLGARAQLARMQEQVMSAACAYLESRRSELRVTDVPRAAFIVLGAIEALTHDAALQRPELLEGDALVDDLTHLVVGFLARPNAVAKLPGRGDVRRRVRSGLRRVPKGVS